jgi:hypothetical protein
MDDGFLLEGMICIMQMIRQAPPYRGSDPPGERKNRHHEKGIHTVCSARDRTGLPIQLLTIDFIDQVFERDKHFLNSETLLSRSSCVYGCSERDLVGASFSITAISFSTDLGSVISIFRSNVLVAIESPSFLF